MAGKIVDVFSPNLIRDADYASLSSWTVEGTPTGAEGRLNLKKGDRAEQTFMFSTDEESEGISGFYFSGNTISNGTTPNTDATVTAIVQYNDGSDESVVILVTPTQSSSYFSHKFGVTETEELYPVSGKVIIEAHGEASIGVLGFYMNYGIEIKEIEKPGIPPNLLKNSSFETGIVKREIPSWSGDATLAEKAHPLRYEGLTDDWSVILEGNAYLQYGESISLNGNTLVLSWHTVGDGAKFELFGDDGTIIYRGNVSDYADSAEWLRQYAVIAPRHFGRATSVGIRFIGTGGTTYLDGIKLEETEAIEQSATMSQWSPHEDDLAEKDPGNFWLKSFKVGNKEYIQEFTDEDVMRPTFNPETDAIKVPYASVNQEVGVRLEFVPGIKEKYGAVLIGNAYSGILTPYELDDPALSTMSFPNDDGHVVAVSLSDVPTEEFDPRFHVTQIYAIMFDNSVKPALTSFTLGGVEYISEKGLLFHNDYNQLRPGAWNDITVEVPYTEDGELTGFVLEFEDETKVRDAWVSYKDTSGNIASSNFFANREGYATDTFPWGQSNLVVEIETVDSTYQYYGIKFVKDQGPKMLRSIKLDGKELIGEPGIMMDPSAGPSYQVSFSSLEQFRGISLALMPEYGTYNIMVGIGSNTGQMEFMSYNDIKSMLATMPIPGMGATDDAPGARMFMQYFLVDIVDQEGYVVQKYGIEFVDEYDDGEGYNDFVIEAARAQYYEGITFLFSRPYATVLSVNVSLGYASGGNIEVMLASTTMSNGSADIPNVYYELMYDDGGMPPPTATYSASASSYGNQMIKGVRVFSNYSVGENDYSYEVSMQAVVSDIPMSNPND